MLGEFSHYAPSFNKIAIMTFMIMQNLLERRLHLHVSIVEISADCVRFRTKYSLLLIIFICPVLRVFQVALRGVGVGIRNISGGDFFTGCWKPEEECFSPFEHFSKLKTAFCGY